MKLLKLAALLWALAMIPRYIVEYFMPYQRQFVKVLINTRKVK